MGRIQSSVGLVTGVNIEDTVNQLMQLNAIPRDRLTVRNQQLQDEQIAITELTALVIGVQLTTDRLGQSTLFSATSVDSSNTSALAATSTGSPQTGSYSFVPVRQAQSQQLTSSLLASSDQTLSDGEFVIHTGGFLDESVSLDELNGGNGVARGFIRVTDRSGVSQSIDLRFAQSAGDVVDAINSNDSLRVVASLDGDSFQLTDVSGSTSSNLKVEEVSGGTTASDLGLAGISTASNTASGSDVLSLSDATAISALRDRRGLDLSSSGTALQFQLQDGTTIDFTTQLDSNTASLGQLVDEINAAGAGSLQAGISSSGDSLEIQDLTSGGSTFAITSPTGDLAEQLGLDNASAGGVITGDRLLSGLSDVLLSSLGGGSGLGTLGQITITDRSGASDTIDLSSAATLGEVLEAINGSSAGVVAQLNRTKTGIEIADTTGSTAQDLTIANADGTNSATALQIEGAVSAESVDSGSLHRQFISRNSKVSDLNRGAGLTLGSIRFTDSLGKQSAINLTTLAPSTLGDIIDGINELDIGVTASINETGDGLLLVDTAGGTDSLLVEEVGTGSIAAQLGIVGSGTALTVGGSPVTGIDGSQTIRIATTASTTVSELADQVNALSNGPVTASLLDLNSAGGVRLLLNSNATGQRGRVAIDSSVGIAFSETSEGRDALLALGANESSGGVLVSSATNDFDGLIPDVQLTVKETSDTPVTVTISENNSGISKQIETLVTQFNSMRDKLDEFTVFDEATNSVGVLFGSSSALRVDLAFGKLFSGSVRGAGSIGSLGQIGIGLTDSGKLEFDKSKFEATLAADPAAVKEFFTNEESGFSAKAKSVIDSLASVDNGALLTRSNSLQSQIEQNGSRIESMNLRLDSQRERLLKQFYNMETAIAKLQQNLTALNQLQVIPPLSVSSNS